MIERPHTEPHTLSHMTPAQAAQAVGVSRWAIMRAVKSHKLKAHRDNKNHWKISRDDLDEWRAHSAHTEQQQLAAHPDELIELREKIASVTARAEVAEALLEKERETTDELRADRKHWRELAEKLTDKPSHRNWWPWSK